MYFHAYIGCLEKEKIQGNDYLVDFSAKVDISAAAESDNLQDAVDYSAIYDLVAEQMAVSCNLLENAAARCRDAVCSAFPQLSEVSIRICKKNPPVNGPVEYSAVTIE